MRTVQSIALSAPCFFCKAFPTQPCQTRDGFPTGHHSARMKPVLEAFYLGYGQGEADTLALVKPVA